MPDRPLHDVRTRRSPVSSRYRPRRRPGPALAPPPTEPAFTFCPVVAVAVLADSTPTGLVVRRSHSRPPSPSPRGGGGPERQAHRPLAGKGRRRHGLWGTVAPPRLLTGRAGTPFSGRGVPAGHRPGRGSGRREPMSVVAGAATRATTAQRDGIPGARTWERSHSKGGHTGMPDSSASCYTWGIAAFRTRGRRRRARAAPTARPRGEQHPAQRPRSPQRSQSSGRHRAGPGRCGECAGPDPFTATGAARPPSGPGRSPARPPRPGRPHRRRAGCAAAGSPGNRASRTRHGPHPCPGTR